MDSINYDQLIHEAKVHFSRSGGKGGQNVNKVESRVELSFNIEQSHVLDDQSKAILLAALKNKIDHEGNIHITASTERHQHSNRILAEKKLITLIKKALTPKKQRVKTEPSRAAHEARLTEKKKQSKKKHERSFFE